MYREINILKNFLITPFGCGFAAILATFFWGSAFPAVKLGYSLNNIQPNDLFLQIEFAGYRFIIAASVLILLCIVFNRNFFYLNKHQFIFVTKIGAIQTFFQYIFFYMGICLASGITSSIIAGTLTFFQLGWAYFLYKDDKISLLKILATFIGFSGVVFYLVMDHDKQIIINLGSFFMLAAMCFAALGNVLYRKAPILNLNPLQLTALQMLLGGLGLLLVGAIKVGFFPFHFTSNSIFNLLYLSLISAVSFLIWNSIMTYNKTSNVSVYLFLIPIWGTILSSIYLGEHLNWYLFPTLILVSCAVIFTQLKIN